MHIKVSVLENWFDYLNDDKLYLHLERFNSVWLGLGIGLGFIIFINMFKLIQNKLYGWDWIIFNKEGFPTNALGFLT